MSDQPTTAKVAVIVGVREDLLRKWIYRGHLKLAPRSVRGAGRGHESRWSDEAVAEAIAWNNRPRKGRKRTRC